MQVNTKIKIFLAPSRKEVVGEVYLVSSFFNKKTANQSLYLPEYPFSYSFNVCSSIEKADLVLIPQAITERNIEVLSYLRSVENLAKKYNKPTALFIGGDLSHTIQFPEFDFYVFRGTQYRENIQKNDILIPPICEDLGSLYGFELRYKSSKPKVSFCGWAGFNSQKQYYKYLVKNFIIDAKKILLFKPSIEVYKKGLYFRRKAINILERSNLIEKSFILRNSFSGNERTISLSKDDARKEYINNIKDSDFVLTPKGDANYSVRFFEALSLGRIPILIDTDTCLPLENEIDYSEFILKISYRDMKKIPEIISNFYSQMTDEVFVQMQKKARKAFENHLRYDSFFNEMFVKLLSLDKKD